MVAQTLIDDHVSQKQALTAAKALIAHAKKSREESEEQDLLPTKDETVWLVVATKRIPRSSKVKPIRIPLAHPVIDPRETSICLLTKDPQREYKDLLAEKNINFVSRVVGVAKLKGKHKPFEARRQLLKEHGMFLADQRIVHLLPGLLGKMFFDAKKQPVPVDLTAKDLKKELARAVSSTYMHQNAGTCVSIKLGTLSHTPEQIVENLTTALPAIVRHVEGGWENVLSLSIKTGRSTALPVWSCSVEERFSVPSLDKALVEARKKKAEEKPKGKSKKRKAEEVDGGAEGEDKPKKTAKAAKAAKASVPADEEEEEEEFGGFGASDDEQAAPAEESDSASEPAPPPKAQPKATSKSKTDNPGSKSKANQPQPTSPDSLEPLPLISSAATKSKKSKPAKESSAPAPAKPAPELGAGKALEKPDKGSKKGASVQLLQKKLKGAKGGKEGTKRKVLGKKRLED